MLVEVELDVFPWVPLDIALTCMALIWTGSAGVGSASLSFFLNTTVFAMAGASGARNALAAWRGPRGRCSDAFFSGWLGCC